MLSGEDEGFDVHLQQHVLFLLGQWARPDRTASSRARTVWHVPLSLLSGSPYLPHGHLPRGFQLYDLLVLRGGRKGLLPAGLRQLQIHDACLPTCLPGTAYMCIGDLNFRVSGNSAEDVLRKVAEAAAKEVGHAVPIYMF